MLSQPPAPSAILFDVGGTLLEERRFDLEAGIRAVVGDDAETVAKFARTFRLEVKNRYRTHHELLLAQWLIERFTPHDKATQVQFEDAIWSSVVTLVPRPGIAAILRQMCDDNVPVAAVSNAAFSGRVLAAELEKHGLQQFLRFVLTSADVGVRKPHPAIFETALSRLGAKAECTWFVGDTMEEDIVGASKVGLWPVWFSQDTQGEQIGFPVFQVRDSEEFLQLYRSSHKHPG